MSKFWENARRFFNGNPSRELPYNQVAIRCSSCRSDSVLPQGHWARPSSREDTQNWECPPCVNKSRAFRTLPPLGRRRSSQAVIFNTIWPSGKSSVRAKFFWKRVQTVP